MYRGDDGDHLARKRLLQNLSVAGIAGFVGQGKTKRARLRIYRVLPFVFTVNNETPEIGVFACVTKTP